MVIRVAHVSVLLLETLTAVSRVDMSAPCTEVQQDILVNAKKEKKKRTSMLSHGVDMSAPRTESPVRHNGKRKGRKKKKKEERTNMLLHRVAVSTSYRKSDQTY